MENLTNLITLNISHNQFTSIPEEIGNMLSLKKLYLHNNHIKEMADELTNLERLDTLNIRRTIYNNNYR